MFGQDYIEALRVAGCVVKSAIVMAAVDGIVRAKDVALLESHDGNIVTTKDWAKSLLRRMKYIKCKCSNAGIVGV